MVSHPHLAAARRPLLTLHRVTHHRVAGLAGTRCTARVLDRVTMQLCMGDLVVVRTGNALDGESLLRLIADGADACVARRGATGGARLRRRRIGPGALHAIVGAWPEARAVVGTGSSDPVPRAARRTRPGTPPRLWLLHGGAPAPARHVEPLAASPAGGSRIPSCRAVARWARLARARGDAVVVVTSAPALAAPRAVQDSGVPRARVVREGLGAAPDRSEAAPIGNWPGDVRWYALVAGRLVSDPPPRPWSPGSSSAPTSPWAWNP